MYLWVAVPDGGPSEAFATRLLEHGIVVSPGTFFGPSGEGYVRFALVPTLEECERAAEILQEAAVNVEEIDRRSRPRRASASPRRSTASGASTRRRRRRSSSTSGCGSSSRSRSARSSTTTRSRSSATTRRTASASSRRRRALRLVPLAGRRADAELRQHRRLGRPEHDGRHVGDGRLVRADRRGRPPRRRRRHRRRARAACRRGR